MFDQDVVDEIASAYEQVGGHLGPMRFALSECLEKVSGRNRQLVEMWYIDQRDPRDIMKRMGIAKKTVYVLLHRARIALRSCVENRLRLEGQS